MIIVSNTSPLIALAKIENLFVLSALFKQILLPALSVGKPFAGKVIFSAELLNKSDLLVTKHRPIE